MESARNKLMDILSNYQGFKKCTVILVFDAYKVDGDTLEIQKYHNIHVVYTKQAETADQYIEKVVHHIGRKSPCDSRNFRWRGAGRDPGTGKRTYFFQRIL